MDHVENALLTFQESGHHIRGGKLRVKRARCWKSELRRRFHRPDQDLSPEIQAIWTSSIPVQPPASSQVVSQMAKYGSTDKLRWARHSAADQLPGFGRCVKASVPAASANEAARAQIS
jgi:hypothetical protein